MMRFSDVPGFVSSYEVELDPELPGGATQIYRFGPPEWRGRDECLVKIRARDKEWTAAFRGGGGGASVAMASPSPQHFFLSVAGQGYWVDTENPKATEVVRVYPVREVRAIPEAGALICTDDTDMLLFTRSGVRWVSRRIASDGLKIMRADARGVWGKAWDAVANKDVGFFVNLATGVVEGGVAPEDE
jgi:hypothetical protein